MIVCDLGCLTSLDFDRAGFVAAGPGVGRCLLGVRLGLGDCKVGQLQHHSCVIAGHQKLIVSLLFIILS